VTLTHTPSQTVGPFFAIGLTRRPENELAPESAPGAVSLRGRLLDGAGMPIADGLVEISDPRGGRWGRAGTDGEGRFSFVVAKPEPPPGAAPHLEVFVFARGLLRHQLTRIYFPDEAVANAADPVLSSLGEADRETLLAVDDDGALRFDIHMQGERATVFFAH
jgi:protocatechuate 3,4-dioxygenase, alpha subunit